MLLFACRTTEEMRRGIRDDHQSATILLPRPNDCAAKKDAIKDCSAALVSPSLPLPLSLSPPPPSPLLSPSSSPSLSLTYTPLLCSAGIPHSLLLRWMLRERWERGGSPTLWDCSILAGGVSRSRRLTDQMRSNVPCCWCAACFLTPRVACMIRCGTLTANLSARQPGNDFSSIGASTRE